MDARDTINTQLESDKKCMVISFSSVSIVQTLNQLSVLNEMTKINLSICLIFFSLTSLAQFDYSFDFVRGLDRNKVLSGFISRFESSYDARIGANVNVKVQDITFIKSGIRFTTIGTKEIMNDLRWPSEISSNGWMPDPSLPRFMETIYKRRYIEIPLHVRFQFGQNALSGFVELGFSPHIYLNTKMSSTTNLESSSETINETELGGKRIRNSFVFGIGVNYTATNRIQVFAQPTIRRYQSHLSSGLGLKQSNIGIELGLRYGFGFIGNSE